MSPSLLKVLNLLWSLLPESGGSASQKAMKAMRGIQTVGNQIRRMIKVGHKSPAEELPGPLCLRTASATAMKSADNHHPLDQAVDTLGKGVEAVRGEGSSD